MLWNKADERKLPGAAQAVLEEHANLAGAGGARAVLQKLNDALSGSKRAKKGVQDKIAQGQQVPDWSDKVRDLPAAPDSGRSKSSAKDQQDDKSDYLDEGVFPTYGLALSGGGIRSASFCTGALQALQKRGVFNLFDYLSTVSGGGYIGSTVTLNNPNQVLLDPHGGWKDSEALKTLRNNANYLKFGSFKETLRNAAIYLRGLTANIIMVAMLLLAFATLTSFSNPTRQSLYEPDVFGIPLTPFKQTAKLSDPAFIHYAFVIALFLCLALFIHNIAWAILVRRGGAAAGLGGKKAWFPALVIGAILLAAFLELQPYVVGKMFSDQSTQVAELSCPYSAIKAQCMSPSGEPIGEGAFCSKSDLKFSCAAPAQATGGGTFNQKASWLKSIMDNISTWAAPFVALVAFLSRWFGNALKESELQSGWTAFLKRNLSGLLVWLAGIVFILALWFIYLRLVYWGIVWNEIDTSKLPGAVDDVPARWSKFLGVWKNAQYDNGEVWIFYFLLTIALFILQYFFSPNSNSLHRLYRDRLGEAFCFVQNGLNAEARAATPLASLNNRRPIPIINAAINLQRSKKVKMKGRMADFFSFTPLRVGSEATGYAPTEKIAKLKEATDLDIASAVAISGAAASSNMGAQSLRPLAPLLAFLNIRLGYWFPNPRRVLEGSNLTPNIWYFFKEAFGMLDEKGELVYLTDGGHIENLGLYELLRRRCRLIMVIDAEADQKMRFGSFVALQRYARIDLGVDIDLPWAHLASVCKGAMAGTLRDQKGPHCAVGRIRYDGGGYGVLVYVKASVSGDENDYILDYNQRNEAFPHESTGDQFFSEEQFEVYRALGFHVVDRMLGGDDKIQSDKGLEHLNDSAAAGTGVKEAAMLLGLESKPYGPDERIDNISNVTMVQSQPIPLKVNLAEDQVSALTKLVRSMLKK